MSDTELAIDEGTSVGGRYRVVKKLGSGGRGLVFEARAQGDERVAVKLILGMTDPADRERVLREINATADVHNEHIVPVIDHGFDGDLGMPFVVMPLIDGSTLDTVLRARAPIEPQGVVKLARQLGAALEAIHAHGVVHRDVKPSNVLLEHLAGNRMRARLSDFGLSMGMAASVQVTAPGASLGTPLYMAPEQALDAHNVDARADLWSLGATLYHGLTGHPPFHGAKTKEAWLEALAKCAVTPISEQAFWVPEPFAAIVHRLLAREPSHRFADASALLTALSVLDDAGGELKEDELRAIDISRDKTVTSPVADHGEVKSASSEPLSSVSHDVDIGMVISDQYTLVKLLGQGGMGAVYEATTPEGTSVAVKVIKPDVALRSTEARRRFVREARTAMAIESEHVVKVLSAGTDPASQIPYIVMEMLTGSDLGSVVEKYGPLDPELAATVIMQACRGLAAAHRQGMIHRDIKPGNIFLHELGDGTIRVKLCDFGIARQDSSLKEHASTGLTQTGGILGSPLYMSPEQAQNAKQADARSDVWSMCAALYEALSGQPPWTDCSTIGEVLLRLYTRDVPLVQDAAPWVDTDLARLLHKGLAKDPEERHASADELGAALEGFARDGLRAADVHGVSDKKRSTRAPRLSLSHASGVSVSSTGRSAPVRGRWAAFGAAALAVAVIGGFAVTRMRGERVQVPPGADSTMLVAPSVAAPSASRVSARVRIDPPSATVSVEGTRVPVDGGWISVEALPGARVEVVVEHDDKIARESVVLTAGGEAIPAAIGMDAGTIEPVHSTVAPPRPTPHEPKRPAPAASPARPAPTAPAAPPSTGPTFLKEW